MKDLSRVEQTLENMLWWSAMPFLAMAVYHMNWWPVALFMALAMVLERAVERRQRKLLRGDA